MGDILVDAIHEMLLQRASQGNAQSRHGIEAAYRHEVSLLCRSLSKMMDDDALGL